MITPVAADKPDGVPSLMSAPQSHAIQTLPSSTPPSRSPQRRCSWKNASTGA